jgi:hypothetical protein
MDSWEVHLVEILILYTMPCVNLQNSNSHEIRKPNFVNWIENKIFYQMYFLVFDQKFRGGIFCKFLKNIPAEFQQILARNPDF